MPNISVETLEQLRSRVTDLEQTLAHQRQLTEVERQRAEALEQSARAAWRTGLSLADHKNS